MHYCASLTTGTGNVVAVADDAQTCTSLSMQDVQMSRPLLPVMSSDQGFQIALAIIGCWGLAAAATFVVDVLRAALSD